MSTDVTAVAQNTTPGQTFVVGGVLDALGEIPVVVAKVMFRKGEFRPENLKAWLDAIGISNLLSVNPDFTTLENFTFYRFNTSTKKWQKRIGEEDLGRRVMLVANQISHKIA